ncbi:MAG: TetR/AcrR family transcriptional regulator [Nocardioides sp.]|uniref:TetR/AcrR family transcriptional regulator n=1 Tax=Nocardioides sp. TaxID=35761 RepID=UPI0039E4395C
MASSTSSEALRRGEGRQRIVDAATELFITRGYAGTTTRDIAMKAGLRQPSLYTHFSVKADILVAVMMQTVRPSVDLAAELTADTGLGGVERLVRLVEFDVRMLCGGPWNIALLGYLPEVRTEEVLGNRNLYQDLRAAYRALVAGALAESGRTDVERTTDVVMTLVEGVVLRRVQNPDLDPEELAPAIARAARAIVS